MIEPAHAVPGASEPLPKKPAQLPLDADDAYPDDAMGFTVTLERVFQGPLDLLLQLVREKELEIHAVSLSQVCDAYCHFVRTLEKVDVDQAADYLVVAATLLAIKSRSLLPQEEIEAEDDPFDPGEELVQQLLAYKSLREAADELGERHSARARLLPPGGRFLGKFKREDEAEEADWDLGDVSLWDLLQVFRRLEKETGFLRPHHVRPTGRSLRSYVQDVWDQLDAREQVTLSQLLEDKGVRREDAAFYLVAFLELAKQRAIDLRQDVPFGDVTIRRSGETFEVNLEQLDESFDEHGPESEPEVGELLGDEA
ncbi:MAG TPA: segregation/condensation protein A [Planctomycetota bacterium]